MVPPTEVHPEPEVQEQATPQSLVSPSVPKFVAPPAPTKHLTVREEGTFQSSMLEYNRMKRGWRLLDVIISLTVNTAILATPIFLGLYFTDTLDMKQFTTTFLAAPPPPPPPAPPAASAVNRPAPPKNIFENSGKLVAPTVIPKQIAMIKEAPI